MFSLSSEAGCKVLLFPGFYRLLIPKAPVAVHELPPAFFEALNHIFHRLNGLKQLSSTARSIRPAVSGQALYFFECHASGFVAVEMCE
jgi:hypothetical protein